MANHQVLKSDVDSHVPGEHSVFPHCQLSAECSGKRKKMPKLTHKIDMVGAKEPFTYSVINMDPYLMSSMRSMFIFASYSVINAVCVQLPVLVEDHPLVEPLYQLTEKRGG